jgi:putative transcriptional regulator
MAKAYKSEAMAAVHEMMEGFYQSGAIDKQTMREFDDACLTAVEPMPPRKSAQSGSEHLSQPVFARYLNVSKGLVSDWERVKKPGGPALRLLTVIQKRVFKRLLDCWQRGN